MWYLLGEKRKYNWILQVSVSNLQHKVRWCLKMTKHYLLSQLADYPLLSPCKQWVDRRAGSWWAPGERDSERPVLGHPHWPVKWQMWKSICCRNSEVYFITLVAFWAADKYSSAISPMYRFICRFGNETVVHDFPNCPCYKLKWAIWNIFLKTHAEHRSCSSYIPLQGIQLWVHIYIHFNTLQLKHGNYSAMTDNQKALKTKRLILSPPVSGHQVSSVHPLTQPHPEISPELLCKSAHTKSQDVLHHYKRHDTRKLKNKTKKLTCTTCAKCLAKTGYISGFKIIYVYLGLLSSCLYLLW